MQSTNEFFARLPRPQKVLGSREGGSDCDATAAIRPRVPTKSALILAGRTKKESSENQNEREKAVELHSLGNLIQEGVRWSICLQQGRSSPIMVQRLNRAKGAHIEKISPSLNHKNIAKVRHLLWEDDLLAIGWENCRYTLNQILHVHRPLFEQQIQFIARSVFNAISHLTQHGVSHQAISLSSIRIVVSDLRVVLSR